MKMLIFNYKCAVNSILSRDEFILSNVRTSWSTELIPFRRKTWIPSPREPKQISDKDPNSKRERTELTSVNITNFMPACALANRNRQIKRRPIYYFDTRGTFHTSGATLSVSIQQRKSSSSTTLVSSCSLEQPAYSTRCCHGYISCFSNLGSISSPTR